MMMTVRFCMLLGVEARERRADRHRPEEWHGEPAGDVLHGCGGFHHQRVPANLQPAEMRRVPGHEGVLADDLPWALTEVAGAADSEERLARCVPTPELGRE